MTSPRTDVVGDDYGNAAFIYCADDAVDGERDGESDRQTGKQRGAEGRRPGEGWRSFNFLNRHPVPFAKVEAAVESQSFDMSFEQCIDAIQLAARKLARAPVNVVESKGLRIVRFPASDGSILMTCSRMDKKLVVAKSPHGAQP
jgi:hypothetical protein